MNVLAVLIGAARSVLRQSRLRGPGIPAYYTPLIRGLVERDVVAVWGFLNSEIGIGTAARGYADALFKRRRNTLRYSIPLPGRDSVAYQADKPRIRAGCNIVVINPPELLHGNLYFPSQLMSDTYKIGVWHWELAVPPEEWRPAYDLVDEIWTSSTFTAKSFATATDKPVFIIPLIVQDWCHAAPNVARQHLDFLPKSGFVFLAVFDFLSGFARKNPLGVVKAFRAAFGDGREGPYLVLKYHSAAHHPEQEARLRDAIAGNDRIILVGDVLSLADMRLLRDACDCFVSLHRAEGFGLNIAEAMIAGRPVICTNYSGNMDFTNHENTLLVEHELVAVGQNDYFSWEGQVWAEPNLEMAADMMRRVFQNEDHAAEVGRKAREHILENLGEDTVMELFLKVLEFDQMPA
ncbi:MAG TPA: glycosyltransferase family 4 protein [Methylocystis sp.]|jgi:glycosyltransferase involved in cell wall biosynthesis